MARDSTYSNVIRTALIVVLYVPILWVVDVLLDTSDWVAPPVAAFVWASIVLAVLLVASWLRRGETHE